MSYVLSLEQAIREGYQADTNLRGPLRPFVFGSRAALHRFSNASEKPTIALGAYDTQFDKTYPWPGRKATSKIDLTYAKLFLSDVYLNYWNDYVGAGSTITPVANFKNRIQSNTVRFKTHKNNAGTTFARNAAFKDRDVAVGDIAYVRGTVLGVTYELWSSVAGYVNDVIAASIAAATSDAGNKAGQSLTTTISQLAGTPVNDVDGAANGAAYESSADGAISRTYTITVIQSSTGGDATTARLSVVSSDGGDNVASVTPAAFGAATAIGTKGLTVTFSQLGDVGRQNAAIAAGYDPNDFIVGQQWRVTVNQAWTAPAATSGGTYTGTTSTGYIVKVTRGGQVPTVDNPVNAPTAGAATAGGSLAAGTYFAKYTFVTANGETSPSPASASFTTSGGDLTIPLTLPDLAAAITAGATSANVYLSTTVNGTYRLYKTGVALSPTNLTTAYNNSAAAAPTSNTATITSRVGKEPQVTISTTTGVDASGPHNVQAKGQALAIGNFGVTVSFDQNKLSKGDIYHINATAADTGQIVTLVLNNDLPDGLATATDLDLRLFIPRASVQVDKKNVTLNADNWLADQTFVYVKKGIQLFDPTWTDGGVQQLLPVYKANAHIEYREWLVDDAGKIINVNKPENVATLLGPVDPDNPLAYAVSKALQNVPGTIMVGKDVPQSTQNTSDIIRCAVLSDAPDAANQQPWKDVLTMITGVEDIYTLVPLSTDASVHQLVVEHVAAQSSPVTGLPRRTILTPKVNTTVVVVDSTKTADNATAMATVAQDPATSVTSFTYLRVPAGNAKFVTNGVRAGDIVRYQYSLDGTGATVWTEYVVDSVLSEDAVRLRVGPAAAIGVAQKVEVWRNLSKDEVVSQLTALAASYNSARVLLLWPDEVLEGATSVPAYHLGAAVAAAMGSIPSHQGMTNLGLLGFTAMPRSTSFFNRAQLAKLSDGGVFVVTMADDGTPYVRRGVTTKVSPLHEFEEMCQRNQDMFTYIVQLRWKPYIGVSNVNDVTLGDIGLTFEGTVRSVSSRTNMGRLGSAVHNAKILDLKVHPTLPDRIQAKIQFTGPYPLNQVELTIVI